MVTVTTDSPNHPEPQPATVAVIGYAVAYVEAGKLKIESELMTLDAATRAVEGSVPERGLCSVILPVHVSLDVHQVFAETIATLEERAAGIRNKVETLIRESN